MGHLGAFQLPYHVPTMGNHQGPRARPRYSDSHVYGASLDATTTCLQRGENLKNRRVTPFLGFLSDVRLALSGHVVNLAKTFGLPP